MTILSKPILKLFNKGECTMENRVEKDVRLNVQKVKESRTERIVRLIDVLTGSRYSRNFMKPPVPKGFVHYYGQWYDGFTIGQKITGNLFTWIPVGVLKSNGTLDGKNFNEKFGRRNFMNEKFSNDLFSETVEVEQIASIKKYGGFYVSTFSVSNGENGRPASVKGRMPLILDFENAAAVAKLMIQTEELSTHILYGAEYDTILEWIIESGAQTKAAVVDDSSEWGNYHNERWLDDINPTGSLDNFKAAGIYDFAGNTEKWTNERFEGYPVFRGGNAYELGSDFPAAYRDYALDYEKNDVGFHVGLWLK